MSSFKKVRRSLRIGNVDWATSKFEATHHVKLVCEFLEVRDMLAMRRVDKNLLSRVDLLKPMAIKKVKASLLKLGAPESLLALMQKLGGVISGEILFFAIMGFERLFCRPNSIIVYWPYGNIREISKWTVENAFFKPCYSIETPEYNHRCDNCWRTNILFVEHEKPKQAASECHNIPLFGNWFDGKSLSISNVQHILEKKIIHKQVITTFADMKDSTELLSLVKPFIYYCGFKGNIKVKELTFEAWKIRTIRVDDHVVSATIRSKSEQWPAQPLKNGLNYMCYKHPVKAKKLAKILAPIKGMQGASELVDTWIETFAQERDRAEYLVSEQ